MKKILAHELQIDTPLEFALLSYYSQAVLNIRPAQADTILPADNPKLADKKLGEAVLRDMQIWCFLGDTEAAERHDKELDRITARGDVSRAEIEAFQRSGIRKLVSDIVDEKAAENQPTNPTTITEIKQILTDFLLNPTRENHNVLHQKERVYASTDGQRGVNAAHTLIEAISVFNSELGSTVIDPSRLNR